MTRLRAAHRLARTRRYPAYAVAAVVQEPALWSSHPHVDAGTIAHIGLVYVSLTLLHRDAADPPRR
jgi:hypothetical protein